MLETCIGRKRVGVPSRTGKNFKELVTEDFDFVNWIVAVCPLPLLTRVGKASIYPRFINRLAVVTEDGVQECPGIVTPLID
jgi:hypothetical protein